MHTYLFNLEKGGLHEVLDSRELDNTDENARAITLMCFEEFKADKTIPYKSGLLRNWDRRTISKVERYNTYVQGILDENYKGIFDPEFLDMVDSSEEEAREAYENSVGVEADFLIGSLMDNAPTEEQRQELIDLYKEIYSHASYSVDSATEIDETTYGVKVTVAPH